MYWIAIVGILVPIISVGIFMTLEYRAEKKSDGGENDE